MEYKIQDLVDRFKTTQRTIRYYEEELGLDIERDEEKGHRIYTEEDVELFEFIFELKESGMRLDGIKKMLAKRGVLTNKSDSLVTVENNPILTHFRESILQSIGAQLTTYKAEIAMELKEEVEQLRQEVSNNNDKLLKSIENHDKLLMENIRVLQDIRREQAQADAQKKQGFFERLFHRKKGNEKGQPENII